MKYLFLAALVFAACQKHESQDTQQRDLLEEQQTVRDFYCGQLNDSVIEARCDRATFSNLADAFCPNRPLRVERHDWNDDGQLYRDFASCLADLDGNGQPDSKSECSPDMFITRLHYWLSSNNLEEANKVFSFLDGSDWYCGEGDRAITYVGHLQPLIRSIIAHLEKAPLNVGPAGLILALQDPPTPGAEDAAGVHNYYLTALSIWAKARISGYVGEAEKAILGRLAGDHPNSCIFRGLKARFIDGDQSAALGLMSAEFSADTLPGGSGWQGWGSAPPSIMQITCAAILEGR